MIDIVQANNQKDFFRIEQLANIVWHEHYITIISLEQIDYMLKKYNSVKAIEERAQVGVLFFLMTFNAIPVGYLSLELKTDFLYISKLYLLKEFREKKIAKQAMFYSESFAKEHAFSIIKLHVNKYNTNAILVYEKMGFIKEADVITDIGNGFIMDDYLMMKFLKN